MKVQGSRRIEGAQRIPKGFRQGFGRCVGRGSRGVWSGIRKVYSQGFEVCREGFVRCVERGSDRDDGARVGGERRPEH